MESVSKIAFFSKNDGEKWSKNFYFEIPPCGKKVIFVTEFFILAQNHPFYEVENISLFAIIFRPNMVIPF
jgi:hypothetical protein